MAAPNFVFQWRTLSGSKVDLTSIGAGNPINYITADGDWAPLLQSLDDIRSAIVSGAMHGFQPQLTAPVVSSGSYHYLYVTGSTNDLFFMRNGTPVRLTSGGTIAGGGLGSGPGVNIITSNGLGSASLDLSYSATWTAPHFFSASMSASSIVFRGAGVNRASISVDSIIPGSVVLQETGQNYLGFFDSAFNGFKVQAGIVYFRGGATDQLQLNGSTFGPYGDNAARIGFPTVRWSGSYSYMIDLTGSWAGPSLSGSSVLRMNKRTSNVELSRDGYPFNELAVKDQVWWSLVEMVGARVAGGMTAYTAAGSFTTGVVVQFHRACTIQGLRFAWDGAGGAKTIKVSTWDVNGNRLQTANIPVNGSGIYTASFAPYSVPATGTLRPFGFSMWENTGVGVVKYTGSAPPPSEGATSWTDSPTWGGGSAKTVPNMIGPNITLVGYLYHAGDAKPDTSATNEFYPIEPIITVP